MNPAHTNGISPALLAAYQNAQSQQSQSQFNPQPQFTPQQQPTQFQQSPSTPSKFPYNGMQQPSYPAMYNGTPQFMNPGGGVAGNAMAHGSMMTPGQVVQAGLMHHGGNSTQMLSNGRQPQQMVNIPQMNTGQIFQKPANTVNGMNLGSLSATVGQQIPGISPAQLTQLAGMNPQERQKAMLYLQHQHQQQQHRMLQQQLASQNIQQGVHQTPQQTQQQLPFDRPPSSMSTHQSMMPPPPRPPTSLSRPGTSHSQGPGQPPQNRPPSRPGTAQPMPQPGMTLPDGSPAGIFHYPQGHEQGEIPGSPSRGAKRKLSGSNLAGQTPRMGSQPLPMGVQNLQTPTMDGQPAIGNVQFPGIPMSQPQQTAQQRPQFPGGSRQSVNGVPMMGGTPGMQMGPPPATRNQMPQMLDGTANIVSDPFSSTGMPNLANGLPHQVPTPQLGGIGGVPPGPLGTHPGSASATNQMLGQVPQHPSLHGQGPSAVTPNLGALPPTLGGIPSGSNLPQGLPDATRMSIGSGNSMANLMSANTPMPTNKLPGAMNSIGIGRPGSISASNSMSLPPSTPGSSIPPLFPPTNPAAGPRIPSSGVPHLNPKVTQVTVVSLAASATEIPTLSKEEIENVKQWIKSDKEHEELQRSARERMTEEVAQIIRKAEWWEKDDQVPMPPSRGRRDKFSIGLSGARGVRRKAGQRMGIRLYVLFIPS